MTEVEQLSQFVDKSSFNDLSAGELAQLKIRVLDTIGVAIGALDAEVIRKIKENTLDFGGRPLSTMIGGEATSPDRAAFYNGALVRYLDFMDSTLTPGETFHPSDNFGAVLAAAEYARASGKEFLTALGVAYEVQSRLSENAPVRAKGFDHTTQGAYAVAAGVAKALRLDAHQTANAVAMSGTANNALRVTRTGALSNWKGLAYANTAFSSVHCTFLAMHGITGPLEVFEGNKGFKQSIAGPFFVDWKKPGLNQITRSIVKKYNAEIHSQSALEGALQLSNQYGFSGGEVRSVLVETFQVAYDIIGGGEEGSKTEVQTKEDADHSLPYMIAAALIDGELLPDQYRPERIKASDVQSLLRRVRVVARPELTLRFPNEMPAKVTITLNDGSVLSAEKSDYDGFHTRPMRWNTALLKFDRLVDGKIDSSQRNHLVETVRHLEELSVRDLTSLLRKDLK